MPIIVSDIENVIGPTRPRMHQDSYHPWQPQDRQHGAPYKILRAVRPKVEFSMLGMLQNEK